MPTPHEDPFQTSDQQSVPVADPELCGRFAAWFATALASRVDSVTALTAIESGSDGHTVAGWHDWWAGTNGTGLVTRVPDVGAALVEFTIADVFDRLLEIGVKRVSLVLPVAGDPLGLVGTGRFSVAALDAECGVLLVTDHARVGLIPTPDRRGSSYLGWRWQVYVEPLDALIEPVDPFAAVGNLPPVDPMHVIEQADRALARALHAATHELSALDLAHWRPEVAAGRKEAEAALRAAGQRLPPGWPPAARALAERALMLWRIVRVARADAGAASASGSQVRGEVLRGLSHAVREAAMVAYNVPLLTLPVSRPANAVESDLR
ncbi:MAG TPA: hypothetical protein VK662_12715 [Acidothermaceae bacterium]|nr:hypothetical protein [Acidothermaceae bacterium]